MDKEKPWAFTNCENSETDFTCYATVLQHIYVPAASVNAYEADPNWVVYVDKIQAE